MRKTNSSTDTVFTYDSRGHLIAESTAAGVLLKEYVWLGDMPLAVGDGTGTYFIHVDHLNTPRLVADATGTTVWRWDQQEPFGDNIADENPSGLGTFAFPLRFSGQQTDAETGTSDNYFRTFKPELGRYIQSDPIALLGGLNTYAYVFGNPLRYTDPRGLVVKGEWVKTPTITDWAINVTAIQPTLGWKWLPPSIKLIIVQLEGMGRIEYEIHCSDDKNMCGPSLDEWSIRGARPFVTPKVSMRFGPSVIPDWRINLALTALDAVIEYGQGVAQINGYVAAEIAKLLTDPTTYCRAFPHEK